MSLLPKPTAAVIQSLICVLRTYWRLNFHALKTKELHGKPFCTQTNTTRRKDENANPIHTLGKW